MVLSFAAYRQSLDTSLEVGSILHADIHRYPGSAQRALVGEVHEVAGVAAAASAAAVATTVAGACAEIGRVLAAEPWLDRVPATLHLAVSALCIALVAAATFIITAVDAFRRDAGATNPDRRSGTGGYSLMGETLLPVVINPQSESGREELNLTGEPSLDGVTIERFRLKPGDDSSCLNLYQPKNPRILGAREEFIKENRFLFGKTLASTPEENENPWRLLERESIDGAVPVIADANSIAYVLHVAVGDELLLGTSSGTPLRLRVAGALSDSVLQGELVMSEKNFLRLFPDRQGYRYFLIDAPDLSEAISIASRWPSARFGSIEVRPIETELRVESRY
jgi:hypothetical protein